MNPKLGYYKVNDQIFYNKLQAFLYASPTAAEVTWNFNREVFDKVNWTEEPPGTLDFWYGQRARQIREEADYVILMCSGGADSTNMLYSFLDNGYKVDEIMAGAPLSGLNNWKVDLTDRSAKNTISETFTAQLPLLDRVSKSHPDIKITIHDYFEDMLKMKTDEWIYEASGHWIHFSATCRHSLDKFPHIKNLAESGKRIAVVYAIDKPILFKGLQGHISTVVADAVVNIVTPHFKDKYPNVESVLFYYTPDLPQMMVKQAHVVAREVYKPENKNVLSYMACREQDYGSNQRDPTVRGGNWQRLIIPYLYPHIYPTQKNVWQAVKQSAGFFGGFDLDDWVFKLHGDMRLTQMVKSDMKLFINSVDKKYRTIVAGEDGFIRFSNYWVIGHENTFIQKKDGIIL